MESDSLNKYSFFAKLNAESVADSLGAVVRMMEERKSLLSSSKSKTRHWKKELGEVDLQIEGLKTTIQRLRNPFVK